MMSDFFISTAYAQTAGGGGGMSSIMSFLPFVAVFAIMYFLLIRPQQQRQKQLRNELKTLRRGDRIVTAGGVVGVVQKSREDAAEVEVEIAPNVRVMVLRDTITTVLTSTAKPANDAAQPKK
ncbi:preprotein translocase subunit YajC [Acetobacter tropicalis]|nr:MULTISPECIES: preprotein translocase subunit YajC [Acetobacter]MBC9009822.1 preprotein translocase subunit YajC [Acetobacter tropicalis]MCC6105600.1 preprotein translocase subunit YajC [Acetobacter sp.]MCG4252581.1 preprotein translocase subunit YajC [Acetobacter senegalensis]MCG4259342.1 preprotein translocase subunit YajC [Acetobacter senegalensis]MCG4272640.1 preprotein translocase subunit YajC [Acetobacter senegalensis]